MKIKLSTPYFFGNEKKYLLKCIKSEWISPGGRASKLFEKKIKTYTKAKHAVGLVNCTAALQLSVRLLNPKKNDEILVPSITFVSSVNAILYNNCKPIFIDCNNKGLIDISKVLEFIKFNTFYKNGYSFNKKTKRRIIGIIVVHTFGNLVQLDQKFSKICKEKNIKIIEDAAESLGSFYNKNSKKIHSGTVGDFGCLSFNANKTITSGGGGMLLLKNKNLYKKAIYLSSQAKNNSTFFIHNEVGYNLRISDLHASIGLAQLNNFSKVLKKKNTIHKMYRDKLNNVDGLTVLEKPDYCSSNYWLNIIKIDKKKYGISKKAIIDKFNKEGIETRSVWLPNHLQLPFKNYQKFKLTKSFEYYNDCLCLPSSYDLKNKHQSKIINLLKNHFNK